MTTNPSRVTPIEASWKISDVIRRYPQLIDELASLNQAFRLLRNPLARRVQARLVTVTQAAHIAGMDPERLVSALNTAIGVTPGEDKTVADVPDQSPIVDAPDWLDRARIVAEVDVRELQRAGVEPFGRIMSALRTAEIGQVVLLRSSFEPVPLFDVMAQRGCEHWSRRLGEDDWEIRVFKSGRVRQNSVSTPTAPPPSEDSSAWEKPNVTITIDASELVPPEPLVRIMAALENLPDGGSLLVHHVRRPMHLYPQLDQRGYRHHTHELEPGKIEILIEKRAAL